MSILDDPCPEPVARAAPGACARPGSRPKRRSATRVGRKTVLARVAELVEERRDGGTGPAAEAAVAEPVPVDRAWVLARLVDNVNRAMQAEPVMRAGQPTGTYQYQGSVANRALELIGRELGMFVERSETVSIVRDVSDEPLSDEEWAARYAGEH